MAVLFVPLFKHKHDPHKLVAAHGTGDVDNP
jgi:NHS family xanthosine MFS transporter